jgi:hypothetical protein
VKKSVLPNILHIEPIKPEFPGLCLGLKAELKKVLLLVLECKVRILKNGWKKYSLGKDNV